MDKDEYYNSIRPGLLKQAQECLDSVDTEGTKRTLDEIMKLDEAFEKEDLRKQGKYLKFEDLFQDAVKHETMDPEDAEFHLMYLYFEKWLKSKDGNIEDPHFLTKENFLIFYKGYQAERKQGIRSHEEKKQSWQIDKELVADPLQQAEAEEALLNQTQKGAGTTAQQVLAMHFIFQFMQVRGHEINLSDKARFIEFLTGKNYQNIYTAVGNPFMTKSKEFRFDDLKVVLEHFENLGAHECARMVTDQLSKPRK